MLGSTDLMNVHDVTSLQRSIAMTQPGGPAFDRDEALQVIDALLGLLKANDLGDRPPMR